MSFPEIVSNQIVARLFAGVIFVLGIVYIKNALPITMLLPHFVPKYKLLIDLVALCFFAASVAIFVNTQISRIACYLLALLFFVLAFVIDVRGMFNLPDEIKYMYLMDAMRDVGLGLCSILIANFERKAKKRKVYYRYHPEGNSSSSSNFK